MSVTKETKQCAALKGDGDRCGRMDNTGSGDGYCWQHTNGYNTYGDWYNARQQVEPAVSDPELTVPKVTGADDEEAADLIIRFTALVEEVSALQAERDRLLADREALHAAIVKALAVEEEGNE
jgi:hypothetical protein